MAVDPNNTDRLVVVAVSDTPGENKLNSNPQVFESVDGGSNWSKITGDDGPIENAYNGQAVAFLSQEGRSFLVVGTSNGVYVSKDNGWALLGDVDGIPTVPIMDMTYSSEDDRLVIATLGRGVWYLSNAFVGADEVVNGFASFSPISHIITEPVGITVDTSGVEMEKFPPDDAP
jgi:ligand-binding sensor domain-containing protein